jgi:hypothetical protein
MENEEKFWAIVELFGHTVLAGEVSKCEIGDFVQINIPQCGAIPPWSKMVNPKAIYGITPVTEETARARAASVKAMPIDKWDTEQLFRNRFDEMIEEGKVKMIEHDEN